MERAGPTPVGGIRPPDLVELVERSGPFATVWLGRSGMGAYGEPHDDARVHDVRSVLRAAGAPEVVDEAVGAALSGIDPDVDGVVVVADENGVALFEQLTESPRRELTQWAPVPALTAVLEHRQAAISSVVVLVDHLGADIVVSTPDGDSLAEVEGEDHPVHKVQGGGWSHRRMQQRVQDTWERNADAVAERVVRIASRTDPALIVLGGEHRTVEQLSDALPSGVREVVRTVTGGRAGDGSEERRDDEIGRLLRTVVAEETAELLRTFEQEVGRSGRAVNGAASTLTALQQSQVDVLLVHDDPDDDRTAVFGESPGAVADDVAALTVMGERTTKSGRLADVAVRAALRTGASMRVVPHGAALDGGLGALLRWAPT